MNNFENKTNYAEYYSFSKLLGLFREYGVTKDKLLSYLIDDLGYISDIKTITDKGFKNGVIYRYADDNMGKWPVYNKSIHTLIASDLSSITSKRIVYSSNNVSGATGAHINLKNKRDYRLIDLDELGLSNRIINAVQTNKKRDLYSLIEMYNSGELAECQGIGNKAIKEVIDIDFNYVELLLRKKKS